ncbi:MAG: vWA domain-containing protein [Arcobacter sp.]|uniref:vWA domain-containing protein n=1 Tax=Arcobacter sp. TaxID=1872629 RepID=UPI003B00DC6C
MTRIEKIDELDDEFNIDIDVFVDTTTKTPAIMVLDVSESQSWYGGIENLNSAKNVFLEALKNDDYAKSSVELSVITFNHNFEKILPFTPISEVNKIDNFKASGGTDIGQAVVEAVNDIKQREQYYKANNIRSKKPILILLTDCEIDNPSEINEAVNITNSLISRNKMTMISIGTGKEVNNEQLKRFNPTSPVLYSPEPEDLIELFEWVSTTLIGYSQVGNNESFKSEPLENRRIEFV